VTRDSLIVSGETLRGYYIFQLVECGPDHRLRNHVHRSQRRRCAGVPGALCHCQMDRYKKPFLTYEYWKYVIDPMGRYQ